MIIQPQANNAIDIKLENGDIIQIHEYENTLSFSAMPNHLRVTAHNVSTLNYDLIGENYHISLQVIPPIYKSKLNSAPLKG